MDGVLNMLRYAENEALGYEDKYEAPCSFLWLTCFRLSLTLRCNLNGRIG